MSELFTYKPIRVILSGDKKAAKGLVREGQKLSAALDHSLSFQGLDQGKNSVVTKDYTINVTTSFKERKIEIYHTPTITEEPVIEEEKNECECYVNFAECEIIGITTDSDGNIPTFGDHDEYCVCYDIMVCSYESNGADKDGFVLWERVRPSDFTRYESGDKAIVVFEEMGIVWEWGTDEFGNAKQIIESSSCQGFTADEMNPDSTGYIYPVIIPLVTNDDDISGLSYKPFFAEGIISEGLFGEDYKLHGPDKYMFDTPAAYESGVTQSSTLLDYNDDYHMLYPAVDDSQPSGIDCSVHWTHTSELDSRLAMFGDTCATLNLKTPWSTATEFTEKIWFMYRNRDYSDSLDLEFQIAGGSFAFDSDFHSQVTDKSIYAHFEMPRYTDSDTYDETDVNLTDKIIIFGTSNRNLGRIPDGSISGETIGRVVLQPATKQLLVKLYMEDPTDGWVWNYSDITDIRTGLWTEDIWTQSGTTFTRKSKPAYGVYLRDSDLTLFREMFVINEQEGIGGIEPAKISPHDMDELNSFSDTQDTTVDMLPANCAETGDIQIPTYGSIEYGRGVLMSQTRQWYVTNSAAVAANLVDVDLDNSYSKTFGICYTLDSNFNEDTPLYNFPYLVLKYNGTLKTFSMMSRVAAPPTGVVELGLSYLDVDSPYTSMTTGSPVYLYSCGEKGDTSIIMASRFYVGLSENSGDPHCSAYNGRVEYAEYDYDTADMVDRFTEYGGHRYRKYFHHDSTDTDIGTQLTEIYPSDSPDSPDTRANTASAYWGFTWKSNLVFSSNYYSMSRTVAGTLESVSDTRIISGSYYPILVVTTTSSDTDLDLDSCLALDDIGFRPSDKTITTYSYDYDFSGSSFSRRTLLK